MAGRPARVEDLSVSGKFSLISLVYGSCFLGAFMHCFVFMNRLFPHSLDVLCEAS